MSDEFVLPESMEDDGEVGYAAPAAFQSRSGGFLTDLLDVCRSTGFPVVEMAGWRTNRRNGDPNGYASGRPNHIMVHHTASGPGSDGMGDATYITSRSSTSPIYNVYISRNGTLHLCAAGPSNNAGRGSVSNRDGNESWNGGVPDDSMNSFAIAVSLGNRGTGEPYPQRQTDALVAFVRAAQRQYGIPTDRVRDHRAWTRRKIDMAGQSPWASGANGWDMNRFRNELGNNTPTPPPPPGGGGTPGPGLLTEDQPMFFTIDRSGTVWVGNGIVRRTVSNPPEWDAIIWGAAVTGRAARDWRTGVEVFQREHVTTITDDASLISLGVHIG